MSNVGMGMGMGMGVAVGGGYEYATAAGAAGIGAAGGAVAMQRARSRKNTNTFGAGGASDYPTYEERTSYPAFAGPGPQPHKMYDQGGSIPGLRYRCGPESQEADLLEAAGLGVSSAGARGGVGVVGVGAGLAFTNRRPSEPTQAHRTDVARHKSQGSYEDPGAYSSSSSPPPPPAQGESYAAHYQQGYNPNLQPQQQQRQGCTGRTSGGFSDGHSQEADPFQAAQHIMMPPPLQNPHPYPHNPYEAYADGAMTRSDKGGNGAGGGFGGHLERSDDGRMSLLDEEDYGRQPRVLLVRVYFVCLLSLLILFLLLTSLHPFSALCYF